MQERPEGRVVHYRAEPKGLAPLMDWMRFYAVFWDERMDRLENVAEQDGPMNTATDTRAVVIERRMPHSLDKVWRALTQGPLMEDWLMANDFEPRVGHRFTFHMPPMQGWNGVTDCEVLSVEPPDELSYTWNSSGEEAANGLKTDRQVDAAAGRRRRAGAHGAVGLSRAGSAQLHGREVRLGAQPGRTNGVARTAERRRAPAVPPPSFSLSRLDPAILATLVVLHVLGALWHWLAKRDRDGAHGLRRAARRVAAC